MNHIKTIETVRLHVGNLALTEAQADPRKHLLTAVLDDTGKPVTRKLAGEKRGLYAIKNTVTFKAGEVFGYDGEIKPISNKTEDAATGKLMADVLLDRKVEARLAEADAKAKAEADAKAKAEADAKAKAEAEKPAPGGGQ